MFGLALEDELVDAVVDVGLALALDDRVAVAFLGVLLGRERSVAWLGQAQRRGQRTFHQINSGTIASMFLTLRRGIQTLHCTRASRGSASGRESSSRDAHLVAETLGHLRALIFRAGGEADDTSLDGRRKGPACGERPCQRRPEKSRSWNAPVRLERP